jgi:hypothetical protein
MVETSEGFRAPFRARQYFGRQWVQYEGFYSGHLLFSGVGDDSYIPIGDVWKWHLASVHALQRYVRCWRKTEVIVTLSKRRE